MRVVDVRSDTVTLPTEEMLDAIRTAELGDDVYREDPTVNRLEELAAVTTALKPFSPASLTLFKIAGALSVSS